MGDDLVHMAMVAEDTASKFATAERYVRELSGYKTQFDVFRLMKRVTDFFGAKGFMVMNVPSAGAKTLTGNSVITNWPADFLSEYDMASLLSSSPMFNRLRNTSIPVVFDINVVARERDPKTVGLATDLFCGSACRAAPVFRFMMPMATGALSIFAVKCQPFPSSTWCCCTIWRGMCSTGLPKFANWMPG